MYRITDKQEILECAAYSEKIVADIRSKEDLLTELVDRLCHASETLWDEKVSLQRENERLQSKLRLKDEQLRNTEEQYKDCKQRYEACDQQYRDLLNRQDMYSEQLRQCNEAIDAQRKDIQPISSMVSILQNLREDLEREKNSVVERAKDIDDREREIRKIKKECEEDRQNLMQQMEEYKRRDETYNKCINNYNNLQQQNIKLNGEKEKLDRELEQQKKRIENLKKENGLLEQRLSELSYQCPSVNCQIEEDKVIIPSYHQHLDADRE